MTSKTFASRGARAVIVILAAIALAGEASATSWKAIPVRDAVSKADAIVRGKVAAVEPLDVSSDVVVVEVAAMLKGDMPKDATIRLVATHRGAKGVHRFREGEEGIWLATKLPDREAYAVSGHPVSFQPVAVLDGVLAREPGKTESAVIFARAYEAAGTIARKH